jgi:hypothetical protein
MPRVMLLPMMVPLLVNPQATIERLADEPASSSRRLPDKAVPTSLPRAPVNARFLWRLQRRCKSSSLTIVFDGLGCRATRSPVIHTSLVIIPDGEAEPIFKPDRCSVAHPRCAKIGH